MFNSAGTTGYPVFFLLKKIKWNPYFTLDTKINGRLRNKCKKKLNNLKRLKKIRKHIHNPEPRRLP